MPIYDLSIETNITEPINATSQEVATNPLLTATGIACYWRMSDAIVDGTQVSVPATVGLHNLTGINSPKISPYGPNGKPTAQLLGGEYFEHDYLDLPLTLIAIAKCSTRGSHMAIAGARAATSPFGAYYLKPTDPSNKASIAYSPASQNGGDMREASFDSAHQQGRWTFFAATLSGSSVFAIQANSANFDFGLSTLTSPTLQPTMKAYIGASWYGGGISDRLIGEIAEVALLSAPKSFEDLMRYYDYFRAQYRL